MRTTLKWLQILKRTTSTNTDSAAKPVTKCTNTKAKASNWKVMKLCENQPLKYCTM